MLNNSFQIHIKDYTSFTNFNTKNLLYDIYLGYNMFQLFKNDLYMIKWHIKMIKFDRCILVMGL